MFLIMTMTMTIFYSTIDIDIQIEIIMYNSLENQIKKNNSCGQNILAYI